MDSNNVLEWRDKIIELWCRNPNNSDQFKNFGFESADQYWAFCTAKDWIQDTGEALLCHRRRGFSEDPHTAYLEFWGLLQAVFIQQDAIKELHYSISGCRRDLTKPDDSAWMEIRDLRNLAVGHPTLKMSGDSPERSLTSREKKSYDRIILRIYPAGKQADKVEKKIIELGNLLDLYDDEAGQIMKCLYTELERIQLNQDARL